jgi:hypothetical protein
VREPSGIPARLSTRDPITEARSEGRLRPSVYSTAAYAGSPAADATTTGQLDPAATADDSVQLLREAVQKPRVTPAAYRALLASMGPPAAPPAALAGAAPAAAAVMQRQAAPVLQAGVVDPSTGGGGGGRKQQQQAGKGGGPKGSTPATTLHICEVCMHSTQHLTGLLITSPSEPSDHAKMFTRSASNIKIGLMQVGGRRGSSCQSSRGRPGRCRLMCCAASRWVSGDPHVADGVSVPIATGGIIMFASCWWRHVRFLLLLGLHPDPCFGFPAAAQMLMPLFGGKLWCMTVTFAEGCTWPRHTMPASTGSCCRCSCRPWDVNMLQKPSLH